MRAAFLNLIREGSQARSARRLCQASGCLLPLLGHQNDCTNYVCKLFSPHMQIPRQRFASLAATDRASLEKKTIAIAISGGVDSAVAAYLLKTKGHNVFGIFMRNWDEAEEQGNQNCSVEADFQDAKRVCEHLSIPLHQADFVSEYWNQVFQPFLNQTSRGLTPNPDLHCNRHIKFEALLSLAKGLGADYVATGHYARLKRFENGSLELCKAADKEKDQTYFLASVPGTAFHDVIFPLGTLLKSNVRDIAKANGLHVASRRSSAGICFIGRRKFGQFLLEYTKAVPGIFVDVESGEEIGRCSNMLTLTLGQRASIGGQKEKLFVVGKDVPGRSVYVAAGTTHPALFTHTALLANPHWISGQTPEAFEVTGQLNCSFVSRYREAEQSCIARPNLGSRMFTPTQYMTLAMEDRPGNDDKTVLVHLPVAARSLTPQQSFVMYQGEVCLGSAPIILPGRSVWEDTHAVHTNSRTQAAQAVC